MSIPDLYSYLDYREFCRDFYVEKKNSDKAFSYRSFAKKASVAPAYLKHVIDGKRNLSPETSVRFGCGMGLDEREIEYFENLVRFSQASNLDEKTYYFDKLRKKRTRSLHDMSLADAASLLSDWYVLAIKQIVVNLNTVDVSKIQSVLRRKLPESLIERSIQNLIALGWLEEENGHWKSKASQICFPDEVKSYVVQAFHRQMLEIAEEALEDPLEAREFGATMFSFPEEKVPELKRKVKQLQEDFISYVQATANQKTESNQRDERVHFFGVQCFRLEKNLES